MSRILAILLAAMHCPAICSAWQEPRFTLLDGPVKELLKSDRDLVVVSLAEPLDQVAPEPAFGWYRQRVRVAHAIRGQDPREDFELYSREPLRPHQRVLAAIYPHAAQTSEYFVDDQLGPVSIPFDFNLRSLEGRSAAEQTWSLLASRSNEIGITPLGTTAERQLLRRPPYWGAPTAIGRGQREWICGGCLDAPYEPRRNSPRYTPLRKPRPAQVDP